MLNRRAIARRIRHGIPGLSFAEAYQMVHVVYMETSLGLSEGQEVRISDFGAFKVHAPKPRRFKLPNGEWATTTVTETVKFKPASRLLKDVKGTTARSRKRG